MFNQLILLHIYIEVALPVEVIKSVDNKKGRVIDDPAHQNNMLVIGISIGPFQYWI
jgi:hypothetical protein